MVSLLLLRTTPDAASSPDVAPLDAPSPDAPAATGGLSARVGVARPASRRAGVAALTLVPAPSVVEGGPGPSGRHLVLARGGDHAVAAARTADDGVPPAPLRLTDRGRRVVSGLAMGIGLSVAAVTVVGVQLHGDGGLQPAGSSTVVVRSGDTLWSIARRVAPEEDARAVVDAIVARNGLDSVDLLPGARLQLP